MKKDVKFLIDVGVGTKVNSYLKEMRYDIKCIREIDFRMRDIEILRIANRR